MRREKALMISETSMGFRSGITLPTQRGDKQDSQDLLLTDVIVTT